MLEVIFVFVVQAIFIFTIDHKMRFLNKHSYVFTGGFQLVIASMYVFILPMVAKGTLDTALAYIVGSVTGSLVSMYIHKRQKEKHESISPEN